MPNHLTATAVLTVALFSPTLTACESGPSDTMEAAYERMLEDGQIVGEEPVPDTTLEAGYNQHVLSESDKDFLNNTEKQARIVREIADIALDAANLSIVARGKQNSVPDDESAWYNLSSKFGDFTILLTIGNDQGEIDVDNLSGITVYGFEGEDPNGWGYQFIIDDFGALRPEWLVHDDPDFAEHSWFAGYGEAGEGHSLEEFTSITLESIRSYIDEARARAEVSLGERLEDIDRQESLQILISEVGGEIIDLLESGAAGEYEYSLTDDNSRLIIRNVNHPGEEQHGLSVIVSVDENGQVDLDNGIVGFTLVQRDEGMRVAGYSAVVVDEETGMVSVNVSPDGVISYDPGLVFSSDLEPADWRSAREVDVMASQVAEEIIEVIYSGSQTQ